MLLQTFQREEWPYRLNVKCAGSGAEGSFQACGAGSPLAPERQAWFPGPGVTQATEKTEGEWKSCRLRNTNVPADR